MTPAATLRPRPMTYLEPSYSPTLVVVSLLIACFASYVSLDLAKRVRSTERAVARGWWAGGSIALGTGIWAMHFVGMFAFSLPIELGYRGLQTLLSWIAAVTVSATALGVASYGTLTWWRLAGGALLMATGICVMHYMGMLALDMTPAIVWNRALVAASALIALVASAAALLIFFGLRKLDERMALLCQVAAAVFMGLAIAGMHYTGMAAAQFPVGSVCLSAKELAGQELGGLVMMASTALLGLTLLTSHIDAYLSRRGTRLATSLQQANDELNRRTFHDPLTGLANRLLFDDRLAHALARATRHFDAHGPRAGVHFAVLMIGLDGFKAVNDSLGHASGDAILVEIGKRLHAVAAEADTVARVGGDEFVLLAEDLDQVGEAVALAHELLRALAKPIAGVGRPVQLSASIGIALYPEHGAKLLVQADAAMHAAKRLGGNCHALFEARMDAGAREELALQSDLRQTLAGQQLSLDYQPKFDGRRGQIRGVEALLRWHHPDRGLISPQNFVPLAERYGLITEIGNWVIDEACRQMHAWQEQGLHMRVAINLSVHQLRRGDLVRRLDAALKRYKVEPDRLLCEITESVAMEDLPNTQRVFEELRALGVFLSIDDFGTGYSSLSYLRKLPAQQLKIDRSFVQDLQQSRDARAIVDGVIRMAHALGLSVVAEGVETEAQRDILLALECDELQGFLFAQPMPAGALLAWARQPREVGGIEFSPSVVADLR